MIYNTMQKSSTTVCTCVWYVPLMFLYLVLHTYESGFARSVQLAINIYIWCESIINIRMCSTGGNDSVTKLHANGRRHQQSIDQCTAVQTRVPLTGLCQSVNTALANYNLTACNLRLSKLCRRSITQPPLSRSTPRALGGKSVWRCQSERTPPSTPLILGGHNLSRSKWSNNLVRLFLGRLY